MLLHMILVATRVLTDSPQQDEMKLLCQAAVNKDASLGATLMHTPGWASLTTILDM